VADLAQHRRDPHHDRRQGTADAVYPDPTTDAQRSANRRVVAIIYTQVA
jgi:hypothetical protein